MLLQGNASDREEEDSQKNTFRTRDLFGKSSSRTTNQKEPRMNSHRFVLLRVFQPLRHYERFFQPLEQHWNELGYFQ